MTQQRKVGSALTEDGYHIAYAVLGQGEICHVFMGEFVSIVDGIVRLTAVEQSSPTVRFLLSERTSPLANSRTRVRGSCGRWLRRDDVGPIERGAE